jgi:hypothetical protein
MEETEVLTDKQMSFFRRLKIEPPPTKLACNSIIVYVLEGNATKGENEAARIVISRNYQNKYLGKTIRFTQNGAPVYGTIAYLVAKPGNPDVKKNVLGDIDDDKPFYACIFTNTGEKKYWLLSQLQFVR